MMNKSLQNGVFSGPTGSEVVRASWLVWLSRYLGYDTLFVEKETGRVYSSGDVGKGDALGCGDGRVSISLSPKRSLKDLLHDVRNEVPENLSTQHLSQKILLENYHDEHGNDYALLELQNGAQSLTSNEAVQLREDFHVKLEYVFDGTTAHINLKSGGAAIYDQTARLARQLQHCLRHMNIHYPAMELGRLDLLTESDRQEIFERNHVLPKAQDVFLYQLIQKNVKARPGAMAVQGWDGSMTYEELDRASSQLSHFLVLNNVGPKVMVPLCFCKSIWTVVAMLAVLKAGGAFVPLDPAHPPARLRYIAQQVQAGVILTSPNHAEIFQEDTQKVFVVDGSSKEMFADGPEIPVMTTDSSAAAYIIFTSGTTGVPKGVVVHHSAISSSLRAMAVATGLDEKARMLQFSSYAFDASVFEIFTPLIQGGSVCVPSEDDRINDIGRAIKALSANWAILTPSFVRSLESAALDGIRTLILGGEQIQMQDILNHVHSKNVFGAYGPTECAVVAAVVKLQADTVVANSIGNATGSVHWVVDPHDHDSLAAIGAVGELLIEGPIVGRGYLNDTKKTDMQFISPPAWLKRKFPYRNGLLYKTGDLVRYNADGSLQFIRRKDTQIKIRGNRVDVGEVEEAIRSCQTGASEVAVEAVASSTGATSLVLTAFLVLKDEQEVCSPSESLIISTKGNTNLPSTLNDLKSRLFEVLPTYMVPMAFIILRQMPLSAAGKLDRKRLRDLASIATGSEAVSSLDLNMKQKERLLTPQESVLHQLWSRIFHVDLIDCEESFFSLGGDSLTAIKLVAALRPLGKSLTVKEIFQNPTLRGMAAVMRTLQSTTQGEVQPFSLIENAPVVLQQISEAYGISKDCVEDLYPCSPFQSGVMASSLRQRGLYLIQLVFKLSPSTEQARFQQAWKDLQKQDPMLRTRIVETSAGLMQLVTKDVVTGPATFHKPDLDLNSFLMQEKQCYMDLGLPLARCSFIQNHFVLTVHHAICDAWSISHLERRLHDCYYDLPETKSANFNTFIKNILEQDSTASDAFWREHLSRSPSPSFPALPDPLFKAQTNKTVGHQVQAPILNKSPITKATLVRAAWSLLTAKYSDSANDVVFGTTVNGRSLPLFDIEHISGPTITTIPVRILIPGGDKLVQDFLFDVQNRAANTLPFEQTGIQNISRINKDTKLACSFQNLLVIQTDAEVTTSNEVCILNRISQPMGVSVDYCLAVDARLTPTGLNLQASFDSRVIDDVQTLRILRQFECIYKQLCSGNTALKMRDINYLSPADKAELNQWNGSIARPVESCIHHLIERQAESKPNSPAICSWEDCGGLTYFQLNAHSSRLATFLQTLGVRPGIIVPYYFEKSMWAVVAMLAVLKAGGAIVALDPSDPLERTKHTVKQVNATIILAGITVVDKVTGLVGDVVRVDGVVPKHKSFAQTTQFHASPSDMLFVQFTSGSTGVPKGIVINHRSFATSIKEHAPRIHINGDSRVFQFSNYTYDVSMGEIFTTLVMVSLFTIINFGH